MKNDKTECLVFVESIIHALLPPIVKKCESAIFKELLSLSEDNMYRMCFDFEKLGLTLNALHLLIDVKAEDHHVYYFVLEMDGQLQSSTCAGFDGEPFNILRFLEDRIGRDIIIEKLKNAVEVFFEKGEQRQNLIKNLTNVCISISYDDID